MICLGLITPYILGMKSRRVRSKRVKIDGKNWSIRLQKPPSKGDAGLCVKDDRTIYLCPEEIRTRGIELVCHELIHARLFDIDEDAVEEIGMLAGEVCAWVAKHNDGVIV
jgi:hypothetical protein